MPCGTSSIAVPDPSDDRAAAIARLNDAVRLGRDRKARIVITRG
ncbi:MAG: hypothetical protein RIS94_2219, partial [Pseudomonadota bacterium]